MNLFLNVLLFAAFTALIFVAVTAWQCMKLTRGDADDPPALHRWLRGLIISLVALAVFGGLYLLLGRLTGVAA